MAMAVADLVLMPTQPAFFAVKSLRQTLRHMERLRRDAHKKCAVVLSMMEPENRVHQTITDHIQTEFTTMVIPTRIPLDTATEEAAAANTLVVETSPNAPSSQAFRTMAVHVLRRLGIEPKFLTAPERPLPEVSAPPETLPPETEPPETTPPESTPPDAAAAAAPTTVLPPIPPPPSMAATPLSSAPSPLTKVEAPVETEIPEPIQTTAPPEAIPEGLRPKSNDDRIGPSPANVSTNNGTSSNERAARSGTWRRLLAGLFAVTLIVGAGVLAYFFGGAEEMMLAAIIAVVVAIPVLGYLFFVLNRA